MGAAGTPEADVPRRSLGREDGQGLLRIRRERETQDIDSPEQVRSDTAKAAIWAAIAGVASLVSLAFGPGFFPSWYFLLTAVGYGLLLPAIAILQVRHQPVRRSGALLATIAGAATVTVGLAASANMQLIVAALVVRGVWWWTIGKMWRDTAVMPKTLGLLTIAFAVLAFGVAAASAPMDMQAETLWASERIVLGLWTLALSYALWSTRATAR